MLKISEHIPPGIMENGNVLAFSKVLDGMQETRNEQLLRYERALNPFTAVTPAQERDYLFEVGQLPRLTGVPHWLVERLFLNAHEMFSYKGSKKGLNLFAHNFVDGVIANLDASGMVPQVYFRPDDMDEFGFLTSTGEELIESEENPKRFPFLFGGSFLLYYTLIEFDIKSDYFDASETRYELMQWVPEFVPMSTPETTGITVNFYTKTSNTFIETLNI